MDIFAFLFLLFTESLGSITATGPDDGGEDLFCHTSALRGCKGLGKGDKVQFDPEFDDRKAGGHDYMLVDFCFWKWLG